MVRSASYWPAVLLPHPAVARDAVRAHQVARVVQRVPPVEEEHLAGDRARGGVSRGAFDQRGQPPRLDLGVVVEHHQQIAVRGPRAGIAGRGQPAVARHLDDDHFGIAPAHERDRVVRRAVIHENDLGQLARIGLAAQRIQAGHEEAQAVVVGDDDAGVHGVREQESGGRSQRSTRLHIPQAPAARAAGRCPGWRPRCSQGWRAAADATDAANPR